MCAVWALVMGTLATDAVAFPLDHLATRDDIGLHKIPNAGTSRVLVIPSRIGVTEFPAGRLAELRQYYDPEGGPGTFRDYWLTVSNGAYDPIPTLAEPVLFDECPIPGKTLDDCELSLDDIGLIGDGSVAEVFGLVLSAVRDDQGIDLGQFDVNGATAGEPDGYFDAVVVDSDIYSGVAFPLAALGNQVVIDTTGSSGIELTCGLVAMIPPDLHEFAHLFGFVDLYGGPTMNGLMADLDATLAAFSRQQIGWSEVVDVDSSRTVDLEPVLDGGKILRFRTEPGKYVLVENRGGQYHDALESSPAGIYVYSVDELAFPNGPLGFLDAETPQGIYLPNNAAPYLNVNLPLSCDRFSVDTGASCGMAASGSERAMMHESGEDSGYDIRIERTDDDGTITLRISGGGGCATGGGGAGAATVLVMLLLLAVLRGRIGQLQPGGTDGTDAVAQDATRARPRSAAGRCARRLGMWPGADDRA